jgi:predicted amidohydrolase YtcJ
VLRVQHLSGPQTVQRMAKVGAIASVQPAHLTADRHMAVARLGERRAAWSFPFRTLQQAGVPLAIGSDWTVAPLDVFDTVRAAVHRALPGQAAWERTQRLSHAEALTAYTQGAAYAAFREAELGTLSVGFYADFVVLDGDSLGLGLGRNDGNVADDVEGGGETAAQGVKPLSTYVGGACAWGCP